MFYSDTEAVRKSVYKFSRVMCLLAVIFLSDTSHAEGGSQMGILYGYSVPDADNANPHKMFGVKGTANIAGSFNMGGYYLVTGGEVGTGGDKFDYSIHGIEGIFQLGAGGSGKTFLGLRVGIAKVRTEESGTNLIFSPYHYGPVCGYDFNFTSWLSFGFEGSFVYVEKANTVKSSVQYDNDSFSVLSFLATLQLRM